MGRRGEREAGRYLQREKGFEILFRNWRSPRDRRLELDLVCWTGELLVFVEVKTRKPGGAVRAWMAVNYRKCVALRKAAWAYIEAVPEDRKPHAYRFDVMEVEFPRDGGPAQVIHIENYPVFRSRF